MLSSHKILPLRLALSLIAVLLSLAVGNHAVAQNGQIVFQAAAPAQNGNITESSSSGIFVMNADGSSPKLLANVKDSAWQGWPRWSNEGTQIVFEVQAKDAKSADTKIYKVAATSGEPQDLGLGRSPNWSPDDKQILFSVPRANASDTKNGVWIMNAEGSGRQWFSNGRNACYSSDGGRIAYVNGHEGSDNIYIYDVLVGKAKFMLQEKYQHIYGCSWSPDGKQICFSGNRQGSPLELALMDAESSDKPVKILLSDKIGRDPTWWPGSKILLWMTVEDTPRLHSVDPQTPDSPTLLQPQGVAQTNIDAGWSPDGKQIAFSVNPRGS
ncbi:MAG TPA: hypothetical protein VFE46_18225 [Pirellulales bacterium]|jgi:Tol biopolymer transport system component|nr:hypothetical protein [Pirellulales bacterium]